MNKAKNLHVLDCMMRDRRKNNDYTQDCFMMNFCKQNNNGTTKTTTTKMMMGWWREKEKNGWRKRGKKLHHQHADYAMPSSQKAYKRQRVNCRTVKWVKKSDNGNWAEYKLKNAWGAVKHYTTHAAACIFFFLLYSLSFFAFSLIDVIQ